MPEQDVPLTLEDSIDEDVDPEEVDQVVAALRTLIKSVSSVALKNYLRDVRADVTRLVDDVELPAPAAPEEHSRSRAA
jgi:hypothetical protein